MMRPALRIIHAKAAPAAGMRDLTVDRRRQRKLKRKRWMKPNIVWPSLRTKAKFPLRCSELRAVAALDTGAAQW